MSHDLEDELRHRLRTRAAGFDLAPGAVTAAVEGGRRRLQRTRAVVGGATVLVMAAAGVAFATGDWRSDANSPVTVTSDGSTASSTTDPAHRAPQLITRDAKADPGLLASLSGTLVVTRDNCVAIESPRAGTVGIIWGRGWSAGREDGKAVVYDSSGAVFAREGERVGLTGGGGGTTDHWASQYGQHQCWTENMFEANNTLSPSKRSPAEK